MQFTASTLAVVLSALAATNQVSASPSLEGRASSLCNQPNYGASAAPWVADSVPGSFCGKNKPSNAGAWAQLPLWDGGDVVKCSGSSKSWLKVCNGGNPQAPLPAKCSPPHNFPVGWPFVIGGSNGGGSTTTVCTPAVCNWSNGWTWNCLTNPLAWFQTCKTVTVPAPSAPSSSAKASSSAPASSAAASSAAASSAAASSAGASSAGAASSAGSPTSSAASSTSSAPVVAPTAYPVCQNKYQVQYQNYTLVAPNGYWYGQTVGSALQDASYMTYTLATTVSDCLAACDQIEGCVFVNTYIDKFDLEANLPKHTPGVLTCAMFSKCVGTESNNNWGGQDDPNVILNSDGYCKSGACS